MTYSRVRHLLLIEPNTLLLNCQHVLRGSMQTRYICLFINRQPYNLKSFTRLPTRREDVLSLKIEEHQCVWHTAFLQQNTSICVIDLIPFHFIPFQFISSIREQNAQLLHVIWCSTGWYLVEMFRQRSDFERHTAVKFLHNITAAYVHYSIRWHLIWQYFYTLRWAAIEISLWAWSDVEQSQSQSYQIIGYVLMKLDIVTSLTWDLHNIDITVTWNWHYWLQTFVSHPKEHNQIYIALALHLHSTSAIILFIQNT